MAKPKLNLAKLTAEQVVQLANDIKTAMTGNANFATPIPSLTTLNTATALVQTKINEVNAAQDLARMKLTERNNALEALLNLLTQLAAYVEAASGGDEAKIQSAGMSIRGTGAPIGVPDQVMNLAVTSGDAEGQLDVQWDSVFGAKSFEIQASPDPITSTSWSNRPSVTRSKATLNGFTSGQRIWTRVRAIGAAGPGAWSDPAVKTVP